MILASRNKTVSVSLSTATLVKERSCKSALDSSSLVNFKSGLDRSLILLLQQLSRKKTV